jgi:hypothetical protein
VVSTTVLLTTAVSTRPLIDGRDLRHIVEAISSSPRRSSGQQFGRSMPLSAHDLPSCGLWFDDVIHSAGDRGQEWTTE